MSDPSPPRLVHGVEVEVVVHQGVGVGEALSRGAADLLHHLRACSTKDVVVVHAYIGPRQHGVGLALVHHERQRSVGFDVDRGTGPATGACILGGVNRPYGIFIGRVGAQARVGKIGVARLANERVVPVNLVIGDVGVVVYRRQPRDCCRAPRDVIGHQVFRAGGLGGVVAPPRLDEVCATVDRPCGEVAVAGKGGAGALHFGSRRHPGVAPYRRARRAHALEPEVVVAGAVVLPEDAVLRARPNDAGVEGLSRVGGQADIGSGFGARGCQAGEVDFVIAIAKIFPDQSQAVARVAERWTIRAGRARNEGACVCGDDTGGSEACPPNLIVAPAAEVLPDRLVNARPFGPGHRRIRLVIHGVTKHKVVGGAGVGDGPVAV